MLENLGYDATVFIRNENKLNQMLSGNQILKSLELLAKVELANGILTEKQLPVSEVTLKKRRSAKKAVRRRLPPDGCFVGDQTSAMSSTSQRTFFGRDLTATQLRAGLPVKYLP